MESPEVQPNIERSPEKVAVLVAWPYGNGPRHLGHGASLIPGDVLARYHRSLGDDVLMVSGTDEHGTPNMIAAEKAGKDPQEFVNHTNELIRKDFEDLGMSFDWFTRTTSPEHKTNAQHLFKELVDAGYIEKGTMLGAFDAETGQALPDRYVEGGCPHCGANSRGDQCDGCSNLVEPTELIDPVSKITHNPVEFQDTEHYFLMLDKLVGEVTEWLNQNENLRPNAKAFSLDRVGDLRPRAITRDMSWGIPLPEGYELEGENEKVLYVWFEAVIGYVSASIEWAKSNGDGSEWKDWWQNDDAHHFYVMGKDNVPFHTLQWPAMIAAANKSDYSENDMHQPDTIASTEYLQFNESKLSTSRDNVAYISDLLELVGPDALRYYLVAAGPETNDVNFSFHELARRVNNELIATWGNLVSRAGKLIAKNHDGKVPDIELADLIEEDRLLLDKVRETFDSAGELINSTRFSAALKNVLETASEVNKYIHYAAPWKTAKDDPKQAEKDMYVVMTAIQNINTLLSPFIPHASQKVQEMFDEGSIAAQPQSCFLKPDFAVLTGDYSANKGYWLFDYATPGQEIKKNGHLFKKLDEEKLQAQFDDIIKKRNLGKAALNNS